MRLVPLAVFIFGSLVISPMAAQAPASSAPPPDSVKKAEPGSLAAIPAALLSEALELSIVATVDRSDNENAWRAVDVKYTLQGTPVTVKMIGSDVIVLVTVTPHLAQGGGLLLIAQGQVWFKESDGVLRYRTTVDTLKVGFGERVFFYPLGVGQGSDAPLRIEIVLNRYMPSDQVPTAEEQAKP
ncbi:MAG: hypothetical protein E4H20_05035 [Spirochaetales bacterium]|nr:MAG: hypothetical protein E4H20_05035 [Spirochaetales bacterium]